MLFAFLSAISINTFAGEVKIIKENKAGFWGFNNIEENHVDGESTLQCSGVGRINPKFMITPTSLGVDKKTVNKFVKKLFKQIDKSDSPSGIYEKHGLKATWQNMPDGTTEILVENL